MKLFVFATLISTSFAIKAGVSKVNGSLPIGVPLSGYNHGDRRVPNWPVPQNTEFTTFMMPSTGIMEPTWLRTLVIESDDGSRHYFTSVDAIGADGSLRQRCIEKARALGSSVTLETATLHASHSHSGPGAVSPEFLWAVAPATDVMVPELQSLLAQSCAESIVQAEANLADAEVYVTSSQLYNVTVNRRAKISPYLNRDSIDSHLGVIRVDDMQGKPLATVWNFAIHGTCFGPSNMLLSSDIMGGVNRHVEDLGLGVSIFINADAGDIDPSPESCSGMPNFAGAPIIANAIADTRKNASSPLSSMSSASIVVPFGNTNLNFTLARFENCTSGGPLDICTLCEVLHCDLNAHLNGGWVENRPRFNALRMTDANGKHTLMVTMPGEALSGLGAQIRSDGLAMGFQDVFLLGYSQNHMGYFCTPEEYDIGGYESQLTFWGIETSEMVRKGANLAAQQVRPSL